MENVKTTNTTNVSKEAAMIDRFATAINPRLIMHPTFRSLMDMFISRILKDLPGRERYVDENNILHEKVSGKEMCGKSIHIHFEYMTLYYRNKYQHTDMSSDALVTAYIEAICANVIKVYPDVGGIIYGIIDGAINPDDVKLDDYLYIIGLVYDETERVTHISADEIKKFYDNFYNNEE